MPLGASAAIVPPTGSVDNLLVSVTISASHVAWASIRTEPTLMEVGEAAGVAAALSVHGGVGVREVASVKIEDALQARGGILSVPSRRPAPRDRPLARVQGPFLGGLGLRGAGMGA